MYSPRRLRFDADLDTWGITELATVWEFMALFRTGKVSRSLDRQRRIPKNSLYRWNNWCTCPRGGSDFNFCPWGVKFGTRKNLHATETSGFTIVNANVAGSAAGRTDSRYFCGTYLSMAFNSNTEHVTRLTFPRAANACTRVWFSAQDAWMHVLSSEFPLFTKGQSGEVESKILMGEYVRARPSIVELSGASSSPSCLEYPHISQRGSHK